MRSPEGPKSSTLLAEKRQSLADQKRLRETRGRASAEVARLRGHFGAGQNPKGFCHGKGLAAN